MMFLDLHICWIQTRRNKDYNTRPPLIDHWTQSKAQSRPVPFLALTSQSVMFISFISCHISTARSPCLQNSCQWSQEHSKRSFSQTQIPFWWGHLHWNPIVYCPWLRWAVWSSVLGLSKHNKRLEPGYSQEKSDGSGERSQWVLRFHQANFHQAVILSSCHSSK